MRTSAFDAGEGSAGACCDASQAATAGDVGLGEMAGDDLHAVGLGGRARAVAPARELAR